MKKFVYSFLILFLLSSTTFTYAAGTVSASSDLIGVGARPEGMGSAFVAISDDVNAININPAGIVQLSKEEITFMHNAWMEDVTQEYISYAKPLNESSAIGGSFIYVDAGKMPYYTPENEFQRMGPALKSFAVSVAYAKRFGTNTSVGANFKFIRDKIATYSGNSYAIDLGVIHQLPNSPIRIAGALQNIGTGIKYATETEPLPFNVKIGLAYISKELPLIVSADGNFMKGCDPQFNFGAEYKYENLLSLRIGYNSDDDLDNGITFGAGFSQENFNLDYAFVPMGTFGDSHRVSLTFKF